MKKKNNLAIFSLLILGLLSIFPNNNFAQKTASDSKTKELQQCSTSPFTLPKSISADNTAFESFIKIMSLPSGKRQQSFSNSPNREKANVFKVKLALSLLNRHNLSKDQQSLIIETIDSVSADSYDKRNSDLATRNQIKAQVLEQKAVTIFNQNEAYEIFANLNGDKRTDIEFLKNYVDILRLSMRSRKNKLRELSAFEKSRFWKAQMIYHFSTSNFSKRQKLFIYSVLPLMTENAFNFPTVGEQEKNTDTKNLEAFISTGFEFFTKDEFFAIFMGYGIHKSEPKIKSTVETNSLVRWCDCNWVCGFSSTCTSTSCAISKDGCGILGGSECESFCLSDGIQPVGSGEN